MVVLCLWLCREQLFFTVEFLSIDIVVIFVFYLKIIYVCYRMCIIIYR